MKNQELDIIGLFPSFESKTFGGVQASGREAWNGIVNRIGTQYTDVLYHDAGMSKARTVFRAMEHRRRAKVVLVWHLHLLRLLPFLDHSASRVILFLHGIESWLKPDPLTRLLLHKVHLILTNSDHTWTRFLASNPSFQGKLHRTVHLGAGSRIDASAFCPSSQPAVLMVGRLDKDEAYKGHRQMIEAWPLVVERMRNAQLWIVGDGDLRPELEQVARDRAPQQSVQFFGAVSDIAKERLIAQSRCLALPSSGEGFGLVYLEAMRMGRPCLVSTIDAGREIVNPPEAGLAVDPANLREIADAVHRLLTPGTEWAQWSASARSRYEHRFTGEQFRDRLLTALFET